LLTRRIGSGLPSEEVAKRDRHDSRPEEPLTETDLEREEIIEALLQPDRSRHSELGGSRAVKTSRSSPREQGAAPIDMTKVDE
jgi:hypothetical protein